MKKTQKKKPTPYKGVLSKLNDKPEPKEDVKPTAKEEGVIAKLNDDPEQKE